MMRRLTLAGTLMRRNTPLCVFSLYDGLISDYKVLVNDNSQLPFEMQQRAGWGLQDFLCDRVVPTSRINLDRRVKEAGFQRFDVSELTVHQNASACDDTYWVRFDNEGPQTWEELQRKIGYTVVR